MEAYRWRGAVFRRGGRAFHGGRGFRKAWRIAVPLQCGSTSIMPSVRASLRAPTAVSFALARLVRTVIVVGFAAFALVLLLVRFVVFPHVESYRDALALTLATELGHPVEIVALSTGWDGWNPKLVVQGF